MITILNTVDLYRRNPVVLQKVLIDELSTREINPQEIAECILELMKESSEFQNDFVRKAEEYDSLIDRLSVKDYEKYVL